MKSTIVTWHYEGFVLHGSSAETKREASVYAGDDQYGAPVWVAELVENGSVVSYRDCPARDSAVAAAEEWLES